MPPKTSNPSGERVAKFIARAGVASRRQAEELIHEGRVKVNGKTIDSPALNVTPSDEVAVDGRVLEKPPLRVWLYHKPKGLVTTARDEMGRKTIYDALPEKLRETKSVGRLDLNSEGLLILTNDGALKRVLELPETGWRRKYRVRAYGRLDAAALESLRAGVVLDGERFRPMEITEDREQGGNTWYTVSIREGRNREIRRAFESVNVKVNRLIRTSYGPFQLGGMERGEVGELRARALRTLLGGLLPQDAELAEAPMDLNDEDGPEPKSNAKPAYKSGKPGGGRDGKKFGGRDGNKPGGRDGKKFGGRDGDSRGGRDGKPGGRDGDNRGGRDGKKFGSRDGDKRGGRDGDKRGGRDGDNRGGRDGDNRGGREGDKRGGRDGKKFGGRDGDSRGARDGDKRGGRDGDSRGGRDGKKFGGRDGDKRGGRDGKKFGGRPSTSGKNMKGRGRD